jgi:hypothetical protein
MAQARGVEKAQIESIIEILQKAGLAIVAALNDVLGISGDIEAGRARHVGTPDRER